MLTLVRGVHMSGLGVNETFQPSFSLFMLYKYEIHSTVGLGGILVYVTKFCNVAQLGSQFHMELLWLIDSTYWSRSVSFVQCSNIIKFDIQLHHRHINLIPSPSPHFDYHLLVLHIFLNVPILIVYHTCEPNSEHYGYRRLRRSERNVRLEQNQRFSVHLFSQPKCHNLIDKVIVTHQKLVVVGSCELHRCIGPSAL